MNLPALLLSVYVSIVLGDGFPGSGPTTNDTCVASLANPANATGVQNASIYSSSNALGLWRVAVSTDSWATTIEDRQDSIETSSGATANIWLDTFPTIDLTDGRNLYSACAMVFKGLPQNTILRGQDDDTSCTHMFSQKCVDAITSRAAETARWLVANPTQGPFSNLTPPILGPICQDIWAGIGAGPPALTDAHPFPSECTPFFYVDEKTNYPSVDIFELTNNVSTPRNCTFTKSYDEANNLGILDFNMPPGVRYPFNSTNGSAVASYDALVDQVWPVLTIAFPPANVSRLGGIGYPLGTMTCIRAGSNIKAGSRVPAALPAPTAVHFPVHLSGGAIAGIVIGAVLGVAIIVGVIWWFWRKHRKQPSVADDKTMDLKELSPVSEERKIIQQLDSKGAPVQLAGTQRAELRGEEVGHELASEVAPQELPGSIPISSTR